MPQISYSSIILSKTLFPSLYFDTLVWSHENHDIEPDDDIMIPEKVILPYPVRDIAVHYATSVITGYPEV